VIGFDVGPLGGAAEWQRRPADDVSASPWTGRDKVAGLLRLVATVEGKSRRWPVVCIACAKRVVAASRFNPARKQDQGRFRIAAPCLLTEQRVPDVFRIRQNNRHEDL